MRRCRSSAECHQFRNKGPMMPRQRRYAVMDIVGASHRDGRQRRKIARHRIGPNGFTLDDAGIAVAGLATGRLAIDQHDRPTAALQMQRRGDPDDPSTQNDNASHRCRSSGAHNHGLCAIAPASVSPFALRANGGGCRLDRGQPPIPHFSHLRPQRTSFTPPSPPASSAGSGRRRSRPWQPSRPAASAA